MKQQKINKEWHIFMQHHGELIRCMNGTLLVFGILAKKGRHSCVTNVTDILWAPTEASLFLFLTFALKTGFNWNFYQHKWIQNF